MRVPIAYYLMLLYVTVMFKPLIPIVNDTLSHIFSEAIHIATVHAIYGSNHLEKELSKNSENGNHQTSLATEENVLVHVVTNELQYDFNLNSTGKIYRANKSYTLNSVFISKAGPPPKNS